MDNLCFPLHFVDCAASFSSFPFVPFTFLVVLYPLPRTLKPLAIASTLIWSMACHASSANCQLPIAKFISTHKMVKICYYRLIDVPLHLAVSLIPQRIVGFSCKDFVNISPNKNIALINCV
ncbi:hypothetical protein S83_001351 [Arachis hypogaea]